MTNCVVCDRRVLEFEPSFRLPLIKWQADSPSDLGAALSSRPPPDARWFLPSCRASKHWAESHFGRSNEIVIRRRVASWTQACQDTLCVGTKAAATQRGPQFLLRDLDLDCSNFLSQVLTFYRPPLTPPLLSCDFHLDSSNFPPSHLRAPTTYTAPPNPSSWLSTPPILSSSASPPPPTLPLPNPGIKVPTPPFSTISISCSFVSSPSRISCTS